MRLIGTSRNNFFYRPFAFGYNDANYYRALPCLARMTELDPLFTIAPLLVLLPSSMPVYRRLALPCLACMTELDPLFTIAPLLVLLPSSMPVYRRLALPCLASSAVGHQDNEAIVQPCPASGDPFAGPLV